MGLGSGGFELLEGVQDLVAGVVEYPLSAYTEADQLGVSRLLTGRCAEEEPNYRMICIPDHRATAWSRAISNRCPSCGHSPYIGEAPQMAHEGSTSFNAAVAAIVPTHLLLH